MSAGNGYLSRWMRSGAALLAGVLAVWALAGCRNRPLLYEYQPVADGVWATTDTLRYHLAEVPDDGRYGVSVGVRTTNRYPYEDLWVVVERRDAADHRHRDTLCLRTDDRHGTVLHECEEAVGEVHLTTQEMPVTLLVYHIMRRQHLPGISDVGVKVQATSTNSVQ